MHVYVYIYIYTHMYIYIYIYIHLSLSFPLSLSLYIYIYIIHRRLPVTPSDRLPHHEPPEGRAKHYRAEAKKEGPQITTL